jgi:adenylate kinase
MNLIIIGIQGSGKSTQGNLLSEKFKIPYLSSGHIFREIAKDKTKWGRYVKETMNAGYLIPDIKTIPIIEEYLQKSYYQKGWILDGFPRTIDQAKRFTQKIDKVIYLKVTDKEALWRLSYRNDTLRGDETISAIRKRIELFHKVTEPVLSFYKNKSKLITIDGELEIKKVFTDICKHLNFKSK